MRTAQDSRYEYVGWPARKTWPWPKCISPGTFLAGQDEGQPFCPNPSLTPFLVMSLHELVCMVLELNSPFWYARFALEAITTPFSHISFRTNAAGVVSRTRVVSTRKVLGELHKSPLVINRSSKELPFYSSPPFFIPVPDDLL